MKIAGAFGGPTRQNLIQGLFLMGRWLGNRKGRSDGAMEYRIVGLLRLRRIAPRWSRGWLFLQSVRINIYHSGVASKTLA